MKRIIVLGGGYAGVKAALTLHKRLRKADVEITLIDRSQYHTLLTELHEVAGNRVDDSSVLVPLRSIFQYTEVKLVKDEISEIRFAEKKLVSDQAEYLYDYLVLAGGSRPAYYGIPGMEEHAFSLWSHDDAVVIRDHIRESFVRASQTKNKDERKRLLTLVVCGGGFTGVEMIGELTRWKKQLCREYNIDRREVSLVLVEATDKILTVLPDRLVQKSLRYLDHLGVDVKLSSPVVKVEPRAVAFKNGDLLAARTVIWAGGVEACDLTGKADLALEKRGRVQVDKYQQTDKPGVYCIGDMACGLPALVEAALQTGHAAAVNIVAEIKGKDKQPVKPALHGVMVSIGRWWGVAHLMNFQMSGILAILMKHFINLHYLFEIGGIELCIRYLKHEFFREELPRPIVEAQFVHQRPLFWLVPLRLYLGYMWFTQALNKVEGGWWNNIMLRASATASAAAVQVVQALTAATGPAGEATGGATTGAATAGMSLVGAHTPGWYAWIIEHFIYPHAVLFQRTIIITEFTLGVLFLLGAFTFIAGAISIAMNINFILTTGVYDYWYVFASIAMMAGAGMVFGADRIIMPYLMRQWRYFVRNKRIKIWLWD